MKIVSGRKMFSQVNLDIAHESLIKPQLTKLVFISVLNLQCKNVRKDAGRIALFIRLVNLV